MLLSPLLLISVALAGAHPITPHYDGNCQAPRWSPDGGKLAYEVNYHDRKVIDLYVYQPGEGDPRQVRPLDRGATSLTAGFGSGQLDRVAHEPSWAPAIINRFVYSASTSARDYDLAIDRAGPIASAPGADGGPAWSPDGHWIAFTSARTGQGDLYLLDAHALDIAPTRLTKVQDASELYASFSPDGHSLAYAVHTDTGDNIYIIDDVQHPEPRQITDWHRTQTHPTWSPDGRRLAFYSDKDKPGRFDLYVMTLTTGHPFAVARGVVPDQNGPSWTPDSEQLLYVKDDDERYDPIYRVPITDPGAAEQISTGTVGNTDIDLVRGTDGRTWLAFAAQGMISDKVRDFKRIYVMPLSD